MSLSRIKLGWKLRRRRRKDLGCWIWTGAKDTHGYGVLRSGGKLHRVHHVAMYVFGDRLLSSATITRHTCRRRACFNPEHLVEVGDRRQLLDDARCARREARGKLTPAEAQRVVDLACDPKLLPCDVAERIGEHCSENMVVSILKGRTWKGLDRSRWEAKQEELRRKYLPCAP